MSKVGTIEKIKYVLRAIRSNKNKKKLLKNTLYVLKNQGIRGLKEKIVSSGKPSQERVDIYQRQQQENRSIEQSDKSVLFIVYGERIDQANSATIMTIEKQKYEKDQIIVCNDKSDTILEQITQSVNDYVFFIKEGDYVSPDMRKEYANAFNSEKELIYCDELIYDPESGEVLRYYIKPDFSIYDVFNNDMLQKGIMIKRDSLIGLNTSCDDLGSQVYDWILSCTVRLGDAFHIDRILLLRKGFIETNELSARRRVLAKYVNKLIPAGVIADEGELVVTPKIKYSEVSVVVMADDVDATLECIDSIENFTNYPSYNLYVVAEPAMSASLKLPENIRVITCSAEDSYAHKCNLAVKEVVGDAVVVLMDSMRVNRPDWLTDLLMCLSFPDVAAASPKVIRTDNTIRYAGMIAGGFGFAAIPFNGEKNDRIDKSNYPAFKNRSVSVLSASCFAVDKKTYLETGGMDEGEFDYKFANAQLSFSLMKNGYQCVLCACSTLISYSNEWYDSWYDKEHSKAYVNLLKKYGEYLSEDKYFTEEMKYQYLRGVPIGFRIYKSKNCNR